MHQNQQYNINIIVERGYYLMIKEVKKINLKYLCKCIDWKDPYKYKGSGVYWRKRLNEGVYEITTTVLGHYNNKDELRKAGIYYSKKFNIVEDVSWANLIPEIGDGGPTTKGKIRGYNMLNPKEQKFFDSEIDLPAGWKRGIPGYKKSPESVERTRQFHIGRKRSDKTKERMRNSTRRKRMTVPCTICGVEFTKQNLARHMKKCNPLTEDQE